MNYLMHPLMVPIISLVAGLVILIFPRVLSYIVAIYLIIVGLSELLLYFSAK